jgi:hypothetical protein
LLYIEDLGATPEEVAGKMDDFPSVGQLLLETLVACAQAGYVMEDEVEVLAELLSASIHGKLLFVLKRRNLEPLGLVAEKIRKEIEYLIRREK